MYISITYTSISINMYRDMFSISIMHFVWEIWGKGGRFPNFETNITH